MLVTVIVLGMALTVGFFLIEMVNGWKCEEQTRAEVIDFREKLGNVGAGDKGTVETDILRLGSCVKGIYLKHVEAGHGGNCELMCPKHPNSCWVIVVDTHTAGRSMIECVDIAGDSTVESDFITQLDESFEDEWLAESYAFISSEYLLKISKIDTGKIKIGRP